MLFKNSSSDILAISVKGLPTEDDEDLVSFSPIS
jgi:hypothetical protein